MNDKRKQAEELLERCGYLDNDWMNPEDIQPLVDVLAERDALLARVAELESFTGIVEF